MTVDHTPIKADVLPLPQYRALVEVWRERCRQDGKWGAIHSFDSRTPEEWLTILAEEFGELAEGILKRDEANTMEEATQVAAVAIAILESLQRRSMQERDHDATQR